jgi:hypothetical protein
MSCENCDRARRELRAAAMAGSELPAAYVRIGQGNVLICGCQEHVAELCEKVRDGGDEPEPPDEPAKPERRRRGRPRKTS